jgi:succinate dehydrogenase/fumarate reductase-like Fe-S protein
MDISENYDDIAHCNRCGFCQVACPIFRSTGHESGVARGRLALLRAIIENRLDWSKDIEQGRSSKIVWIGVKILNSPFMIVCFAGPAPPIVFRRSPHRIWL